MVELKRIYWSRQALRLTYSAVIVWLGVSVVLALTRTGKVDATNSASTVSGVLRDFVDSVLAAAALPGLLIVVLFIVAAVVHGRDVRRRDPVRRFSRQQRREGMTRAGGQCEMEAGTGRRCSWPAEHGDHFFPWSKGGSTTMQNFVAACAKCNRTKGARIPSPGQQARIERRRREYVAQADSVSVGERRLLA
jgi:hypothetical protein